MKKFVYLNIKNLYYFNSWELLNNKNLYNSIFHWIYLVKWSSYMEIRLDIECKLGLALKINIFLMQLLIDKFTNFSTLKRIKKNFFISDAVMVWWGYFFFFFSSSLFKHNKILSLLVHLELKIKINILIKQNQTWFEQLKDFLIW